MDTSDIKIKREVQAMADPVLTNLEPATDNTADRQARFAANRLELERLKKAVEAAKEAKKEALRLKLEQEELEDKRIQEEILRMKAELEELNQPSPESTNLQPANEAKEHQHVTNGDEQRTAEDVHEPYSVQSVGETRETNDSQRFNGLSEDVENLITQEAARGLDPTSARREVTRTEENGTSEMHNGVKHASAASSGPSRIEPYSYPASDAALRTHLAASVDGSSRDRLADYLKECEKFFKDKPAWAIKEQIEFAKHYLVGHLLASWQESAARLTNPTWEDYKNALLKANQQLKGPQTHHCERCQATFGSYYALSGHLHQSRSCKSLTLPPSPTATKVTRPHTGTDVRSQNSTNGTETQTSPGRKSISCAQCKLTFPSTVDRGRHRDATGHTIVSPVQPSLTRTPTGPRVPEISPIPGLPSNSHNETHQRTSGHVKTQDRESPKATNPMAALAHSNYKRHSFPDAAYTNGRGSPRIDSELDRRTCRKCNSVFPNRVEMHEHLRDSGHAVPTFPSKPQRSNPNPFPDSLNQRKSTGGRGYANAQHYSSQDEDYIGLGPSSDSPHRSRPYKDPQRTCEKCDTEFPSRIEMFEHIRDANHVMPRKRAWQGRYEDDGGLGGRVSAVRRRTDY